MLEKGLKKSIFLIIIFLFVGASCFTGSITINNKSDLSRYLSDSDFINLAILQTNSDGSFNVTTKEVIYDEYKALQYEIINKISQAKSEDKPFLTIFNLLKEKNLIKQDIKIDEIYGDKASDFYNNTAWNRSEMQPFVSMFAPIIVAGMGFGAGIGDKFGSITGLLYSGGIIGMGAVLCFDILKETIHVHFTFTFPLLLHILSSFIGIMMFPVDFDFISDNFLPLFIYSNFIAIGFSGLAIGTPLGY